MSAAVDPELISEIFQQAFISNCIDYAILTVLVYDIG